MSFWSKSNGLFFAAVETFGRRRSKTGKRLPWSDPDRYSPLTPQQNHQCVSFTSAGLPRISDEHADFLVIEGMVGAAALVLLFQILRRIVFTTKKFESNLNSRAWNLCPY